MLFPWTLLLKKISAIISVNVIIEENICYYFCGCYYGRNLSDILSVDVITEEKFSHYFWGANTTA